MAMCITPINLKFVAKMQSSMASNTKRIFLKHVRCAPMQQQLEEDDQGIMCEPCSGKGWLLCDFCDGQKINVKGANNRIYRRCPSCRAIGCILCSKCKVYKCVTFPNTTDGDNLTF